MTEVKTLSQYKKENDELKLTIQVFENAANHSENIILSHKHEIQHLKELLNLALYGLKRYEGQTIADNVLNKIEEIKSTFN